MLGDGWHKKLIRQRTKLLQIHHSPTCFLSRSCYEFRNDLIWVKSGSLQQESEDDHVNWRNYKNHPSIGFLAPTCVPDPRHFETDPDPWNNTLLNGSRSCSFRQWLSKNQQKISFLLSFFLLITYCRYIYISLQRYHVIKKSQKS